LEKCTEDDAENPPLVLAARHLPKNVFEAEITKEPTPERDDEDGRRFTKQLVSKAKSKGESKADDAPCKSSFRERAVTTGKEGKFRERAVSTGKDGKPKKERIEKVTAEKDKTGKVETTFHVLLRHKVNVNSKNDAGATALHVACERGMIAMVKELLLVKGIDINNKDEQENTPLHTACVGGDKDIVHALIEAGVDVMEENDDEMIPLHVAVVERKLEIVKIILDMRAGDKEELLQAVEKDGNSAFLLAVKSGDEEMVKFFLDNGATVTDQGVNGASALHLAASFNKVKIMELICNANEGEDLLDEEDWNDRTPLHYAAKYNQIEALQFLLDK